MTVSYFLKIRETAQYTVTAPIDLVFGNTPIMTQILFLLYTDMVFYQTFNIDAACSEAPHNYSAFDQLSMQLHVHGWMLVEHFHLNKIANYLSRGGLPFKAHSHQNKETGSLLQIIQLLLLAWLWKQNVANHWDLAHIFRRWLPYISPGSTLSPSIINCKPIFMFSKAFQFCSVLKLIILYSCFFCKRPPKQCVSR